MLSTRRSGTRRRRRRRGGTGRGKGARAAGARPPRPSLATGRGGREGRVHIVGAHPPAGTRRDLQLLAGLNLVVGTRDAALRGRSPRSLRRLPRRAGRREGIAVGANRRPSLPSQLLGMDKRALRKKLRKKAKKAHRRSLAKAVEQHGHHEQEQQHRPNR